MAWSDAARAAALEARRRNAAARRQMYEKLPPSKINALLAKYTKKADRALDKAYKVGQWKENVGVADFMKLNVPLARHYRFLSKRKDELKFEVFRRTGDTRYGTLNVRHKK